MISTITAKLDCLLQKSLNEGKEVNVFEYSLSCGDIFLSPYEYELTVSEESLLDFIYQADLLEFDKEVSSIIKNKVSLAEQKSFFTKLFIYEVLSENEDNFDLPYSEYVTKLNTGFSDGKQKNVQQLLNTYASDELKDNAKFKNMVERLKNIKISYNNCVSNYVTTKKKLK